VGGSTLAQSPEPPPQALSSKTEQTNNALKATAGADDQTRGDCNTAERQKESHGQPNEATNKASEFWTISDHNLKITDTLLVGFTFLLFLATIGLFWATRDLVKGADKNAEKQLRAYVAIWGGAIEPQRFADDGVLALAVRVELKNSGQTPGYGFRTWLDLKVDVPSAIPFKFLDNLNDRAFSIIGPGTNANIDQAVATTPEEIAELNAGTKKLFIWGKVEYKDIFDRKRFFVFRCVSGRFYPQANRWDFGPHKSGYDAN
jgi:hypothetical protein